MNCPSECPRPGGLADSTTGSLPESRWHLWSSRRSPTCRTPPGSTASRSPKEITLEPRGIGTSSIGLGDIHVYNPQIYHTFCFFFIFFTNTGRRESKRDNLGDHLQVISDWDLILPERPVVFADVMSCSPDGNQKIRSASLREANLLLIYPQQLQLRKVNNSQGQCSKICILRYFKCCHTLHS